ncbi:FtsX-like permease family protein [Myxococcota bacterium]|nr:FtsX-like permease family protein [Myxococcota bacterium]MBU1381641.1 FtsX-like permease family protein [Myxococcota bacterium]MBU1495470.1 FtsX-like permease family protein [Myxococcota bacterium]
MILFRYSFRNLLRRKIRTGIIATSVFTACAVLVFFRGLADGGYRQLKDISTRLRAGQVMVSANSWEKKQIPINILKDSSKIRSLIKERLPDCTVSERIFAAGTYRSEKGLFKAGALVGIDFQQEEGKYGPEKFIVSGKIDGRGIVLFESGAKKAALNPGDSVVIFIEDWIQKSIIRTTVSAVISDSYASNPSMVLIPLVRMRRAMNITDGANFIAVSNPGYSDEKLLSRVKSVISSRDVSVFKWSIIMPTVEQFIAYHNASVWIFQIFIFIIITITISNTMHMSVMERIREISILKAVGAGTSFIRRQIILESLILSFLGSLVGAIAGILANWYFSVHGLDPSVFTGGQPLEIAGGAFNHRIHASVEILTPLISIVGMSLLGVVASLYAVYRATNFPITQGIQKRG